jgi:hypothetical protein
MPAAPARVDDEATAVDEKIIDERVLEHTTEGNENVVDVAADDVADPIVE